MCLRLVQSCGTCILNYTTNVFPFHSKTLTNSAISVCPLYPARWQALAIILSPNNTSSNHEMRENPSRAIQIGLTAVVVLTLTRRHSLVRGHSTGSQNYVLGKTKKTWKYLKHLGGTCANQNVKHTSNALGTS